MTAQVRGQRLANVDRTHLVLASGELVPLEISKRTNYKQPKKQKSFNHSFHKVPQRSVFDQVIRLILSPWSLDTWMWYNCFPLWKIHKLRGYLGNNHQPQTASMVAARHLAGSAFEPSSLKTPRGIAKSYKMFTYYKQFKSTYLYVSPKPKKSFFCFNLSMLAPLTWQLLLPTKISLKQGITSELSKELLGQLILRMRANPPRELIGGEACTRS